MNIGMLWFDADRKSDLSSRIVRAADYYRSKYERTPNICFAHPDTLGAQAPNEIGGLKVCSNGAVLVDHFWLGVQESETLETTGADAEQRKAA